MLINVDDKCAAFNGKMMRNWLRSAESDKRRSKSFSIIPWMSHAKFNKRKRSIDSKDRDRHVKIGTDEKDRDRHWFEMVKMVGTGMVEMVGTGIGLRW